MELEKKKQPEHMLSVNSIIEQVFALAIQAAFPQLGSDAPVMVVPSSNPKFGDYQCNSAMPICQVDVKFTLLLINNDFVFLLHMLRCKNFFLIFNTF